MGDGESVGGLEFIQKQDPDLKENDGFFAAAVNPTATTTVSSTYFSGYRTYERTETEVQEVEINPGRYEERVEVAGFDEEGQPLYQSVLIETEPPIFQSEEVPVQKKYTEKETATYPLKENLEARRARVRAYVGSLLNKGLRG